MIETDRKQDELLAIRCQLGEPSAFDALIARWHEPLWNYLRRLTGDDDAAAETVQDVWLRILRGIPRLREGSRLRAWIFGIARRVAMDRLRAKYAQPPLVSAGELDLAGTEEPGDLAEDIALMHEGLARLPVPEREVLVLFYLEELTMTEIAEVVGIPSGREITPVPCAQSAAGSTGPQREGRSIERVPYETPPFRRRFVGMVGTRRGYW